ncbi:MAG: nuclease A inhibitor family protein [Pyrinomonadaceae bacterium]|nr:nuclease A inhibitor family protein [Pyrinomonadaceae bacterium]
MPKRKKQNKLKEKTLEKSKDNNSTEKTKDLRKDDLSEQIKQAAAGLIYISETDAEILLFIGKQAENISKDLLLSQTGNAADALVAEASFTEFFARLTEIQDWFGDEEKETVKKFVFLKELLEKNLRDLRVFKIGKIQLDIYVVGLDAENNFLGIQTKAVET